MGSLVIVVYLMLILRWVLICLGILMVDVSVGFGYCALSGHCASTGVDTSRRVFVWVGYVCCGSFGLSFYCDLFGLWRLHLVFICLRKF